MATTIAEAAEVGGTVIAGGENSMKRGELIAAIAADDVAYQELLVRVKRWHDRYGGFPASVLTADTMTFDPAHYTVPGLAVKRALLQKSHAEAKSKARESLITLRKQGYLSSLQLDDFLREASLEPYQREYPVHGYFEISWREPIAGRTRVGLRDEVRAYLEQAVKDAVKTRGFDIDMISTRNITVGEAV